PLQAADESQFDDLVQVGLNAVLEANFIPGGRQENTHGLDDLLLGQDQPGIAPGSVVFGQLLAQQGQQKTHGVRQLPPRDKARQLLFSLGNRPLPQIGKALGFIQDQLQAQDGHVVPDPAIPAQEGLPQLRLLIPVKDPLEEGNEGPGERSEEHTSELQSRENLVCRLLLEKKKRLLLFHFTL